VRRAGGIGALPVLVALLLLAAPHAVRAGGDEEAQNPPSAGPPGPWEDNAPGDVPYQPTGTRRCGVAAMRDAGPGAVLGLYVDRTACGAGRRLVRSYQRCLERESGRAGGCYGRVYRRCVQPVFLGRCRLTDRFYRRTVRGYRCVERRLYPIDGRYDANVVCVRGTRRIDHSYTLYASTEVVVGTERALRSAWANPRVRAIELTSDIVLHACRIGDPIRESSGSIQLDGHGHTLRQGCFEKRLLRQDGTGFVQLRDVTLTRGGSDGPGAAVTTRGEIEVVDSRVIENLSEEPGGGIIRCVITGNLANDDGGGVYARRGGIQVYDSIVSGNLVDGSGGALGSTGDILVVRSHIDGNTTDGDGGAIYTDEDGDVTVIDSTVNGNDADGPGGAIFTLDGDVTVIGSTINGNRADDRGGAISGEARVTIVNSTIARNAAVAHVGGGIWARGDLYVVGSTISGNYAEGGGGGAVAAGVVGLVRSTVTNNIAPVAANFGAGERLEVFGSIIGPPDFAAAGGQVQPTGDNCQAPSVRSYGYNVITDPSCGSTPGPDDLVGKLPMLAPLADNGGAGETHMPLAGSPALDRIPAASCGFPPLGGGELEGEQHLTGLVDYPAIALGRDQRGVAMPQGAGCDAGAVEVFK
jgi:hypothetical protein